MASGAWLGDRLRPGRRSEEADADEDTYWHSEADRVAVTNEIAVHIELFDQALSDADLKAARIDDIEVQVQRMGSNPSWVTKERLADIEELLESWPAHEEADERVTITPSTVTFGGPLNNKLVEDAAMASVTDFYGDDWTPDIVSDQKVGCDITLTHKNRRRSGPCQGQGTKR